MVKENIQLKDMKVTVHDLKLQNGMSTFKLVEFVEDSKCVEHKQKIGRIPKISLGTSAISRHTVQ